MKKHYTLYNIGKLLILSCVLLLGGTEVAMGQQITRLGTPASVREEILYAIPGGEKIINLQSSANGSTDNLDGYILWYLGEGSDSYSNVFKPNNVYTRYTWNGTDAYYWSSTDNHSPVLASYITINVPSAIPDGGIRIVCDATSVIPRSVGNSNIDLSNIKLSLRRTFIIKDARQKANELAVTIPQDWQNWHTNSNAALPTAFLESNDFFPEKGEVHTPVIGGTNYRLNETIWNYFVRETPADANSALQQAGQVRWRMYDEDGNNITAEGKYTPNGGSLSEGAIIQEQPELNPGQENNTIASIIEYFFQERNGGQLSNDRQHTFYITAEVSNNGNYWYPASFQTVKLEPYAEPLSQEEIETKINTDENYEQRLSSYLEEHFEYVTGETFDGDDGDEVINSNSLRTDITQNYRREPFENMNSFYGFAYPSEYDQQSGNNNRYKTRRSVGRGEFALYRTLNVNNVSTRNQAYNDYWNSIYNHPIYDRTYATTGQQYGYFLYIDAADEAGVITTLTFDNDLCPNTRLIVSAWIANLNTSGGSQDADVGFIFKGRKMNGNVVESEKVLNTFYSGSLDSKPSHTDASNDPVQWQQIYFYFNYSGSEDEYDEFVLELTNNCRNSSGADYAIDDIRIYRSTPDIRVERINDCDASTLEVTTDVLTLFANLGWTENQPIPATETENVLADYTTRKYRYGLMGLRNQEGADKVDKSGNFYFASIQNLEENNDNQQPSETPDGNGYYWVTLNKDALSTVPEAAKAARVSLTTELDLIPTSPDAALVAERYMNIQAVLDYNSDYEAVNEAYNKNSSQEGTFKMKVGSENKTFTMTVEQARQFLGIDDDGTAKGVINTEKLVRTVSGVEIPDVGTNAGDWDSQGKQPFYNQAILELYSRLNIPRIRYPWLSKDRRTIHISTIEVDKTELRCSGETLPDGTVTDGKYHVMIFTAAEVAGGTGVTPKGGCKLVSPFTVQGVVQINITTGTAYDAALCVGAQRQLEAYLLQWDDEGNSKPFDQVYKYIFDWYLDTKEEYDKLVITGENSTSISLKEALSYYRTGVNNLTGTISLTDLEGWTGVGNIKETLTELISEGLLQTGKPAGEKFTMIVYSDEVVAMPYVPDPEDTNIHYCTEETAVSFGEVGTNTPALYPGYGTFANDEDNPTAYLRLGQRHLNDPATSWTIPVRTNIKMATENGYLGMGTVRDITWTDPNTNNVEVVGTVSKLHADTNNGSITFQWLANSNVSFNEGETYELHIPFVQYSAEGNILASECDGLATLAIKVVPEYLTWKGGTDAVWYNDNNWNQSTEADLYMGNKGQTDANGDDDVKNAFTPLYFTKITIPKEAVLSLSQEDGGILNPGDQATANIQYDMAVNNTGTDNSIVVVPYYGNKVEQIYFKPEAKLVNQHYLDYQKAWVEFEIENNRKRWFASPLQDVYAGDFYAPKENGRQETVAFADIKYNTSINSRWAPAFYQKAWNSAINYATDVEGTTNETVAAVKSNWSIEYNDVTVSYPIGKGFYLSVEGNDSNGTALVRLPKADAVTDYKYEEAATKASVLRADDTSKDNSGKLVDLSGGSYTLSLEEGTKVNGDGTHFLVGNPFMTYLKMDAFLDANKDVLASKYWTLTNGATDAAVGTPDVGFDGGSNNGTVAPMQAFFVELKSGAASKQITFTPAMMSATEATTKSASATNPVITLTAERGDVKSKASLLTYDKADNGYKADEDAVVLLDSELDAPMVYTVSGSKAAQVNAVKSIRNIGLGVYNETNDEVTLTIEGLSRLAEPLYLYDAHTRKSVKLEDDSYSLRVAGDSHGRYFLRDSELGSELENTISIYSARRGQVIVSSLRPVKEIKVFGLNGSQVRQFSVNTTQYSFDLPAGIYMIHAGDGEQAHTEKVIVR